MPKITDDAINKAIKKSEFYPLYLLYGEESYLLKNTVSALIKKAVDAAFQSFNLQQFDGETATFNQIQTAYEALPLMSAQKCVTVKNWNIDKLAKSDLENLTALLENPNPSTILVLFYTNPKIEVNKTAKFKKISAIIDKNGAVCEFALKNNATLTHALTSRAKAGGASISPHMCDMLIERCGASYSVLINEVDKLIAYAGEGSISQNAMELLTTQTLQSTAFDLSNAILQHNFSLAYTILDKLFYMRVEPVLMMGAIIMSFTDLYRLKAASLASVSAETVINDFKYRSRYRITKFSKDIARISAEQLRTCIFSLEKADRLIKSSRLDDRIIMEQMLGEMNLALNKRR